MQFDAEPTNAGDAGESMGRPVSAEEQVAGQRQRPPPLPVSIPTDSTAGTIPVEAQPPTDESVDDHVDVLDEPKTLDIDEDVASQEQSAGLRASAPAEPSVSDVQTTDGLVEMPVLDGIVSGLSDADAIRALGVSKDVVEKVAWAVVPALAEAILREEIARLIKDRAAHLD